MDSIIKKRYQEPRQALWKILICLPCDPVWYAAIIFFSVCSIILQLYFCVDGKCLNAPKFIRVLAYILDGVYFVDVVLTFACNYVKNLNLPDVNVSLRPCSMLIFEVASIIPLEFLVPRDHRKLYCLLKINRCIKAIRVLHFYKQLRRLAVIRLDIIVFSQLTLLIFLIMIVYAIYCNIQCGIFTCSADDICYDYSALAVIIAKITGLGLSHFPKYDVYWELITTISCLITLLFILVPLSSYAMIMVALSCRRQYSYRFQYKICLSRFKSSKAPEHISKNCKQVFNEIWKQRRGHDMNINILSLLPASLSNEILVDLSWPAFKHSRLFRNIDLPFLREISTHMEHKCFASGEYLYQKDEWKDKMFYIESGKIQILSEEDGESPIMTFTNGTCIGESCLIISHKAINNIRCKTTCELHILQKKNFFKVHEKFPRQYNTIRQIILQRYREALMLHNLSKLVKRKAGVAEREIDIYTLLWVKNTLHKFMSFDADSTYRHEFENIYILNEIKENELSKLLFCAHYLDALVIGERIEADTDTVFAKTSCLCTLQPSSIIALIWEVIIILLTTFLAIFIPYYAFVTEEEPDWYYAVIMITNCIFWFDLYVQASTGIKTKHGVVNRLLEIIVLKLQTLDFWIDIASCIPIEIYIPLTVETITRQKNHMFHLNRLLKLRRIAKMFGSFEKQFRANIFLMRQIKLSSFFNYIIYIMYCILHRIYKESELSYFFISVQTITGTVLISEQFEPKITLFLAINFMVIFLVLAFYSNVGSIYLLYYSTKDEVRENCEDLKVKLKDKNMWKTYKNRIDKWAHANWEENHCSLLRYGRSIIINFSKLLYKEHYEFLAGSILRSNMFFQCFSNNVIMDVCFQTTRFIHGENQVIFYAGDLLADMYVIIEGYVELIGNDGVSIGVKGDILNLLETCLGIPSIRTCVTKTYCMVLTINYNRFIQTLIKYPTQENMLKTAISNSSDIKQECIRLSKFTTKHTSSSLMKTENPSFHKFGYKLQPDSYEEYDYFIPFDRLYPFDFLRYFLLRYTILPEGNFLYVWECFRCFFAVLACLLYFVIPLMKNSRFRFILILVDCTAFVDLYLRFHVCYYDDKGILITHPLKTAIHYFSHGFIIDFVGAMPLNFLISTEGAVEYFILNLNKFFQLHRYFQFFYLTYSQILSTTGKAYGIAYLPILLILCNYCGSCFINIECKFSEVNTEFLSNVECEKNSVLSISPFVKPINEIRAHFYGVYIATSLLTCIGMQGFKFVTTTSKIFIIILTMLGISFLLVIIWAVLGLYVRVSGSQLHYRQNMKDLNNFMKLVNTDVSLRNDIITSQRLKTKLTQNKCIWKLTKMFNSALRSDILYDYIGQELYDYSPFLHRTKSFYKNLLPHLSLDIILKDGYLQTINDVSKNICILYRGTVDVLAADGTKLATLHSGSIFGNLSNFDRTRLLISIVANCNVEYVFGDASIFQNLLRQNEELRQEFLYLKAKYVSYIPSRYGQTEIISVECEAPTAKKYLISCYCTYEGRIFFYCYSAILFVSCYVGLILESYQLATVDVSKDIRKCLYTSDFLFGVLAILRYRVMYIDIKKYLQTSERNKFMAWSTIISLLPVDALLIILNRGRGTWTQLISLSRVNRLLRAEYLFNYFSEYSKNYKNDAFVLRLLYVFSWTSLSITILAAVICRFSYEFALNMTPNIPKDMNVPTYEKFQIFVRFTYVVCYCLTLGSQNIYYPQGIVHIVLCILVMLICNYLFIVITCQLFSLFNELYNHKAEFVSVIDKVKFFLVYGDVSVSLIARAQNYLSLLWLERNETINPKFLDEASPYLKDVILNDAFSYLLVDHPIFQRCHPDCLRQIVQQLQRKYYFSRDYIQYKGSVDNTMYFIFSGNVHVLEDEYKNRDLIVAKLKAGDSFGILQGLFNKPHSYSFMSKKKTVLLLLNLSSWDYLLKFFPASKENIYKAAAEYSGY